MGSMYWVIIDENGKRLENVGYLDKGEAEKKQTKLNTISLLREENKFYRLRAALLGKAREEVR